MNYQDGFIKLEQTNSIEEAMETGKIMLVPGTNIGIIEGEFYYVKRRGINCFNEILASEIAKQMGIDSAYYDIAYFNNDAYLISKLNNVKTFKISSILKEYYHDDDISHHNNICDISKAVAGLFNNRNTDTIKCELTDIFLFDVIIANPERNLADLKVIDNGLSIHFAPLYDNQKMLINEENEIDSNCILGIKRGNVLVEDLYYFFKNNEELIDCMENKMEIFNPNNIKYILRKVEMHIHGFLPEDLKNEYIDGFGYNAGAIYSCIYKIKKEQKVLKKVI